LTVASSFHPAWNRLYGLLAIPERFQPQIEFANGEPDSGVVSAQAALQFVIISWPGLTRIQEIQAQDWNEVEVKVKD